MNREQAKELIVKYVENAATVYERQLVEQHFLKYLDHEAQLPDPADIENTNLEMWSYLQNHIAEPEKTFAVSTLWRRIAIAASFIIIVSTSIFLISKHMDNDGVIIVNAEDVLPGKNTAILRLEDGTAIQLRDEQKGVVIANAAIKYNDGSIVHIQKSAPERVANNSMLSAATPLGGTYQITLSDGTRVWLNAGSSLKFPATFTGRERRVELQGEAYFEVAKVLKPERISFIVTTDKQQVEVLGTHFNINSYIDESNTKTTLLEGSVRVSLLGEKSIANHDIATLLPNQQSVVNSTGILVKQINAEEAVAWKNGYFDFNEEKLESIMNKISRWYDVTVIYENPALKEQTFTGNISKFTKVSEVLKKLALSKVLQFKIDRRKIIVTD
jgi:transmembrane sensor